MVQYKECRKTLAQHFMFHQEIRNFVSDLGSLYTHIKAYRAAFYAYKINLFSTISSLASGHTTPQFLLPTEIVTIVKELSEDERRHGTELSPASSTHQQCSGNNRIKLCPIGFSTTTDETLLGFGSLLYNYDIPGLRNCLVKSLLLPDAPQAFYLSDGFYHVTSRDPFLRIKNDSRYHGVSVSTIHCQACIIRPSCSSVLSLKQGDLMLAPDVDFCKTNPDPFLANSS